MNLDRALTLTLGVSLAMLPPATMPSPASAESVAAASTPMAQTPQAGRTASYLVNLRSTSRADRIAGHAAVARARGRVVQAWPQIGVLVVHSENTGFLRAVRAARVVVSAGATRSVPVRSTPRNAPTAPSDGERITRETARWNLTMIGAGKSTGSSRVTVAVVDSGVDATHPDLRAAVDPTKSVGCTAAGRPNTSPAAWRATNDTHGTHVAGIIGAARNKTGIVGVAPGVRLASIKVADAHNMIYPEYAVCGVMSAAKVGARVANHSYFVDPFAFWCDDQAGQKAVKESLQRAFAYARKQGVVNVVAAGNSGLDLNHKTIDADSPTDARLKIRRINAGCHDLPAELPHVVTVSAVDEERTLAPFSNAGLDVVDVAAPGDLIMSTVTGARYAEESGTSMAAPHASGVLALLATRHPTATADQLVRMLQQQAIPMKCPKDQPCTTKGTRTSAYGHGLVNARVR